MNAPLRHRRVTLLAAALVLPVLATAQDWPVEGPPAPLRERRVALPAYQVRTLANGLQVVVVPHHEQPSVSFRLLVSAGALQEPADKPGVAGMVGSLLNQGTATKSASEIATLIDSAGGVLGVAHRLRSRPGSVNCSEGTVTVWPGLD
jgi:zinc protease